MAKQIISTLIIHMLVLPMLATPVFAQTDMNPLYYRIYDGDYVWSRNFPRKETSLIAYGFGLFDEIQKECPNAISRSDIDEVNSNFTYASGTDQYGALHGVQAIDVLWQSVRAGGAYLSLRKSAEKDVETLLDLDFKCDGTRINRVGQNVWRMLAGRRPMYRAESAKRSTLLKEFIVPIDTYHKYPGIGGSLAGGAARRVFERDVDYMKGYGMTILECHYDENPNDEYHEEQYYWGPSMGAQVLSLLQIAWVPFVESSQERMDRNMGSAGRGIGHVIHPFKTYGAPRSECPAIRDPDLSLRQIRKPEMIEWPKGKCRPVGNGLFDCP